MSQSKVVANFSYLFYIFQFFGLSFFSIRKSRLTELYKKFRLVHILSIIVISLWVVIDLCTNDANDANAGKMSRLYFAVGIFQMLANLATQLSVIISSFVKSTVEKKIFRKIDKIDKLIKNEFIIETATKKYKYGIFIVIHLSFYVLRNIYRYIVNFKNITLIMYLGYSFMVIIMKIFLMKFYFFVQLMNSRLEMITDVTKIVQSPEVKFTGKQIKTIKRAHSEIMDISKLINDCFGLSLLLLFINLFISITNKTYVLFLTMNKVFQMNFIIGKL